MKSNTTFSRVDDLCFGKQPVHSLAATLALYMRISRSLATFEKVALRYPKQHRAAYLYNTAVKFSQGAHLMPVSLYPPIHFQPQNNCTESTRIRLAPKSSSNLANKTGNPLLPSVSYQPSWLNENYSKKLTRPSRRLPRELWYLKAYSIRYNRPPMPRRRTNWRMLSSARSRSSNGIETR